MELSEAWAPLVNIEEVYSRGILVEERNDQADDDGSGIKRIRAKVYYLKSVDLFVIVMDTGYWSVIACQNEIEKLRHKHLNQEPKQPVSDAFVEYDQSDFAAFQSDFDLSNLDAIKKYGKLLETRANNEIYYIEVVDRFANVDPKDGTCHTFDSPDYRKKYNIPYQDERFSSL